MRCGIAVGVLLAAVGCGSARHAAAPRAKTIGNQPSNAQLAATARSNFADWKRELETRARRAPGQRFANPPTPELRRRLFGAARRYGFEVVSLKLLRPRQLAPAIIVRTRRYGPLVRAMRTLMKALDPRTPARSDWLGWRYEGFYFEAQDERGVPVFVVENFWRGGEGGGGGQWARCERYLPFDFSGPLQSVPHRSCS